MKNFMAMILFFLLPGLLFGAHKYLVIDLSAGANATTYPITYLDREPDKGWTIKHKTTQLVLRRIEPGTFTMGDAKPLSARGERLDADWRRETPHSVTISKPFYIGIFELTQAQWNAIQGKTTFTDFPGATYPANRISYEDLRGFADGAQWPTITTPDEDSFLGKLRKRTKLAFDLPTEAQWEYACRAGSPAQLYSGKSLSEAENDASLKQLARYYYNDGDKKGVASVGTYKPNAWGLYDLYGNVEEWCLDRQQSDLGEKSCRDPIGPDKGLYHALRGGSWFDSAQSCRSSARNFYLPTCNSVYFGARIVCPAGN